MESDPFDERIDISDQLFLLLDRGDVLMDREQLSLLGKHHGSDIWAVLTGLSQVETLRDLIVWRNLGKLTFSVFSSVTPT